MAMSNAQKQAAWRERQRARIAELEAENARLRNRVAELERAKPEPAPKPSAPSPADKLKEARKRVNWMPEREIQECIGLAKAAAVAAHPDRGGTHEAATAATEELAFWRRLLKRRHDERARAEREAAERSARSKAAWAKRKAGK